MLACLLLAACRWSQAAPVVVYRCVAADGSVALQDRPCPSGSTQERSEWRRPVHAAPVPAPAAAAAPPPTAPAPAPADADAAAAPVPPPPLWDCVRHDGSRYESSTGVPERRWVPLWVVGRDPRAPPSLFGRPGAAAPDTPASGPGAPRLPPQLGLALEPGTWVEDRCWPLTPAQACDRYAGRRSALRQEWHLAMPSGRDRLAPRIDALTAILRASCGA